MSNSRDLQLLTIQELTGFLRDQPGFKELRKALAVYLEDENWNEYGCVVTRQGEVFDFKKSTSPDAPAKFIWFREVKEIDEYIQYAGAAVELALELVRTDQFF